MRVVMQELVETSRCWRAYVAVCRMGGNLAGLSRCRLLHLFLY